MSPTPPWAISKVRFRHSSKRRTANLPDRRLATRAITSKGNSMAIGFTDTRLCGDTRAFSARLPSPGRLGDLPNQTFSAMPPFRTSVLRPSWRNEHDLASTSKGRSERPGSLRREERSWQVRQHALLGKRGTKGNPKTVTRPSYRVGRSARPLASHISDRPATANSQLTLERRFGLPTDWQALPSRS